MAAPTFLGYIQACRALMITAILLGFLGLFLGIVGLRCTNIGGPVLSRKAKLAAVAGALHILAGNCGKVMGGPCAVLGIRGGPQQQTLGFFVISSSHLWLLPHLSLCDDTCPPGFSFSLSPCSPQLHPRSPQIPWLQISPSAMFLEPPQEPGMSKVWEGPQR